MVPNELSKSDASAEGNCEARPEVAIEGGAFGAGEGSGVVPGVLPQKISGSCGTKPKDASSVLNSVLMLLLLSVLLWDDDLRRSSVTEPSVVLSLSREAFDNDLHVRADANFTSAEQISEVRDNLLRPMSVGTERDRRFGPGNGVCGTLY
mmetsp:Transcript_123854/g.231778  ORF Transcript_123854/g.231778 Transcript_123854/m.231778 type:complete len:150 (+) Transcript_123854:751-1200(+)